MRYKPSAGKARTARYYGPSPQPEGAAIRPGTRVTAVATTRRDGMSGHRHSRGFRPRALNEGDLLANRPPLQVSRGVSGV